MINSPINVKFRPIKNINRRVKGETVTLFEAGKLYTGVLYPNGNIQAPCEKFGRDYEVYMNFVTFETDKFGRYL